MKKRFLVIISALLMVLVLTSCFSYGSEDNLRLNFKNDKSLYWGCAAVVYEDRIYYVSNELGDAGIYSMDSDGSDVRIEVKNPSITYLQIVDDKLYFTGLREIAEKVYDPWVEAKNKYSIYSYDLETTQSGFVEKEKFMNVISFYIPDDGYKMICSGSINEVLYLLKNDEVISREDQSVKTVSFNYKDEEVKNDFYIIGDTHNRCAMVTQ
jgi:hypothetical protein